MNKIRVTIYDDEGKIVKDEECECFSATEEEIKDMISLIDSGIPAHAASNIVKRAKDEL